MKWMNVILFSFFLNCAGFASWVETLEWTHDGVLLSINETPNETYFIEDGVVGYIFYNEKNEILTYGEGKILPFDNYPTTKSILLYEVNKDVSLESIAYLMASSHISTKKNLETFTTRHHLESRLERRTLMTNLEDTTATVSSIVKMSDKGWHSLIPGSLEVTLHAEASSFPENGSVAGLSLSQPTRLISSLSELLVSGRFSNAEIGRFELTLNGLGLFIDADNTTFRVGADDEAMLTIGNSTSEITGVHALRWGNEALVTSSGLQSVEARFYSNGGPYDFQIEGLSDLTFYNSEAFIPFASIDPTTIVVPWDENIHFATPFSLTNFNADVTYEIVSPSEILQVEQVNAYGEGLFSVNKSAFYAALPSSTGMVTIDVTVHQTFEGLTYTSTIPIVLSTVPIQVSYDPSSLLLTYGFDETQYLSPTIDPSEYLSFSFSENSAYVEIDEETGVITPSATLIEEYLQHLGTLESYHVSRTVPITWTALMDGRTLTTETCYVNVGINLTAKENRPPSDCCNLGTMTENACIRFRQRFGKTAHYEGLPTGALAIEEESFSEKLLTPSILKFDHPMERRLQLSTRCVTTPLGEIIAYEKNGLPSKYSTTAGSRLDYDLDRQCYVESFDDLSKVIYNSEGVPAALITALGVEVAIEDLGITVERDALGAIIAIRSVADGSMEVGSSDASSFYVDWKGRDGALMKRFVFTTNLENKTFSLLDHIYPMVWQWSDVDHDFILQKGSDDEVCYTKRQKHYDSESKTINITTTTYDASQTLTTSVVETIDPINGNKLISRVEDGVLVFDAERQNDEVLNGLGEYTCIRDALGAETSYTYDEHGRMLSSSTKSSNVCRTITYTYSNNPRDTRPQTTVETYQDLSLEEAPITIVRENSFSEDFLASGIRKERLVEGGLVTTSYYYSTTDENAFARGKLKMRVMPNLRATMYEYSYNETDNTLVEVITEGVLNYLTQAFTLIPRKSSRVVNTYDVGGDLVREDEEVYINEEWIPWKWRTHAYNIAHKRVGTVYSDGTSYSSAWNCTGPIWEVDRDGIRTENTYNSLKQLVSSTRKGPHGDLTTTYVYDSAGRVVQTQVGDRLSSKEYDARGRLITETDAQGAVTQFSYPSENVEIETYPNGATKITTLLPDGRVESVTGTAQTPTYTTYGPNWMLTHYGTPESERWNKVYTNLAGQPILIEQAGANNSILSIQYTYNTYGQCTSELKTGRATTLYAYDEWGNQSQQRVGMQEIKTTDISYVLDENNKPWQEQINTVGTLEERHRTDAEGLTTIQTNVQGLTITKTIQRDGALVTTTTYQNAVANPQITKMLDGVVVEETSSSGVQTTFTYNPYKQVLTETDGRNNTRTIQYDAFGRRQSMIDATGATLTYGYNAFGEIVNITNPLGATITFVYDLRGNKVREEGATYPIDYTYDVFGHKMSMTTYRNENETGDTVYWTYDPATGAVTSKTYPDGYGVTYTLTNDGKIATRTDARGIVTTYTYDEYNQLTSIAYSDNTPNISISYDTYGRIISVSDAAGNTNFTYNEIGQCVSEETPLRILSYHYDSYGRDVGYSIDNVQQTTLGYHAQTGRLATLMHDNNATFTWDYLENTNLKSKLTYPNGATAEWSYETQRDHLTQVKNTVNQTVISQYDYTYDAHGRWTNIDKSGSMMALMESQPYSYNNRDELLSGQGQDYSYDDIGNRISAEGKTYLSNALNQYTAINTFAPTYDLNGNQTLVKTSTGEWIVEYNAENRPIRWMQGNKVITMDYDYKGRRIFYKEMDGEEQVKFTRFVYKDMLCVQEVFSNTPYNVYKSFIWDPTEPIATRPLKMSLPTMNANLFYFHDGNKNVSDLAYWAVQNGVGAHYDYAPFGEVTRTASNSRLTRDIVSLNPFRFSSEYHDDTLGLVYYNYRHYNPRDARWLSRDPIEDNPVPYVTCNNNLIYNIDILGLYTMEDTLFMYIKDYKIEFSKFIYIPTINPYDISLSLNYEPFPIRDVRKNIINEAIITLGPQKIFDIWVEYERKNTAWLNKLPKCPKKIELMQPLKSPGKDWDIPHPRSKMHKPEKYHPDAAYEMRTRVATSDGAGNQCIYDTNGCLISAGFSAGTADRRQAVNPTPEKIIQFTFNFLMEVGHYGEDVVPFDFAYQLDGNIHGTNVQKYISVRPSIY